LSSKVIEFIWNVPPDVLEFFQRDIERAKKATADRARERLRRQKSAAEGN